MNLLISLILERMYLLHLLEEIYYKESLFGKEIVLEKGLIVQKEEEKFQVQEEKPMLKNSI